MNNVGDSVVYYNTKIDAQIKAKEKEANKGSIKREFAKIPYRIIQLFPSRVAVPKPLENALENAAVKDQALARLASFKDEHFKYAVVQICMTLEVPKDADLVSLMEKSYEAISQIAELHKKLPSLVPFPNVVCQIAVIYALPLADEVFADFDVKQKVLKPERR